MSNTELFTKANVYVKNNDTTELHIIVRNKETGEAGVVFVGGSTYAGQARFYSSSDTTGKSDRFLLDFDTAWEITRVTNVAGEEVNIT